MNPGQEPSSEKTNEAGLYQQAGVDTAKAESLVSWLQESPQDENPSRFGETVEGIGGFASLFRPRFHGMSDPLLVSSTDGVGTKVLLALEFNQLDGVGIDLVGMCGNDLLTVGAYPLFFLDYFATGKLDPEQFKQVLTGIRQGLQQCGAQLLGGETAEMPGLYQNRHFDLAGFMVGVVDRPALLGKDRVKAGDLLVGLGSNGFHSNGFSLIRSWLQKSASARSDKKLIANLLRPTKIYGELTALFTSFGSSLHALAHITGGGIPGNLVRVVPDELCCHLEWAKLKTPAWMQHFIESQNTSLKETLPVFNLGVGMIACLDPSKAEDFIAEAKDKGLDAFLLGELKKRQSQEEKVIFHF